jgi:uncharacterized membrane protein YjgN (DUF898 family)
MSESYFDGGLFGLIGYSLLGFLITVLTLGICYPWAIVMLLRWKISHTVIDDRRMRFTGSAIGLFGMWIKWLLLIIVTLGIYSFWVGISMKKWETYHTHMI